MTIVHLVAIRDSALNQYGMPMAVPSIGVALRSFTDEVNRAAENNDLYKHPEDFELYQMGTYETDTGLVTTQAQPLPLLRGKDAVRKEQ